MPETENIDLITIEEIQELRNKLRQCSKGWVSKVANKMHTRKEPVDAAKVYNIVNGVIRDQYWRLKFKLAADIVMEEFKTLLANG